MTRHLAIVGPTASGKSAVALAVATAFDDVEIVSLDSMQVYRGMDIGTAKPSPAEQAAVRHHLVDVHETFFKSNGILAAGQINRMKHVELMCELMLSVHQGDVINRKAALDRVMAANGLTDAQTRKAVPPADASWRRGRPD